jgi:hypothetical protein
MGYFITCALNQVKLELSSKKYEMDRAGSTHGEEGNAYRILVRKPERKRPLGRPRSRRVENIELRLREIEWGGMDWTDLVQYMNQWRALVNTVINLRVPQNIRKFLSA